MKLYIITTIVFLLNSSFSMAFTSFSSRLPKNLSSLKNWAIIVVDAWGLCAVPKASLTYTSPCCANFLAKVLSPSFSSGWNLRFSNKTTCPGIKFNVLSNAFSPTQDRDGGDVKILVSKDINIIDGEVLKIGTGEDLQMFHNGTNSFINNFVGNLEITQNTNDADIIFKNDDGSGGTTE